MELTFPFHFIWILKKNKFHLSFSKISTNTLHLKCNSFHLKSISTLNPPTSHGSSPFSPSKNSILITKLPPQLHHYHFYKLTPNSLNQGQKEIIISLCRKTPSDPLHSNLVTLTSWSFTLKPREVELRHLEFTLEPHQSNHYP